MQPPPPPSPHQRPLLALWMWFGSQRALLPVPALSPVESACRTLACCSRLSVDRSTPSPPRTCSQHRPETPGNTTTKVVWLCSLSHTCFDIFKNLVCHLELIEIVCSKDNMRKKLTLSVLIFPLRITFLLLHSACRYLRSFSWTACIWTTAIVKKKLALTQSATSVRKQNYISKEGLDLVQGNKACEVPFYMQHETSDALTLLLKELLNARIL